ncbi:MAG: DUF885 domain-containing protein [Burkholderiales bacterium]|nr:DUF885 domain-containing protein [Burkholderiales bacterium]
MPVLARAAAALAVLVLCGSCTGIGARDGSSPVPSSRQWDAFVEQFITETFAAQPHQGVNAGRHEFDGRLPDLSAEGLQREVGRLHAARERIRAFDEATLAPQQRYERDYVLDVLERELFWAETMQWPTVSPGFYGWALDPNVYVAREYAPLPDRMRAYVAYAKAIPRAAAQARANLKTPMPRTYVQLGRIIFGGLASFYANDVPAIFAPVADARLQEEFRAANALAIAAMKELDAWLAAQEATATEGFAIGAARFAEMMWATEKVDVPIARLKEIGERDLERNLAALRAACARYLPGKSLADCTQKVKAEKPPEGPVAAAQRQLESLRAFIVARKVVSIPGPEQASVAEAPSYRRWNFAYIEIPGPYEKNLPSTYYIAPPDQKWSPAEQLAYLPGKADLLFVSVHEVWPGHFLQFLHNNRARSTVGRVFVSYAFSEGWAHYTEEMMWEVGLNDGDPATHIGQLLNALLRNVRYVSAIGLHTGGMTVAQSEAMFRDKAFQDPGNSRQQAARGTFDPGYGNYTLGKLMIRRLRDDWTASRGGRAAWQAFHDEFLAHGSPPIPVIRKVMLGPTAGPAL